MLPSRPLYGYNERVRTLVAAIVVISAPLLAGLWGPRVSFAATFIQGASLSSSDFRILDPQHAGYGGIASSSSSSFRMLGTIGDAAIGSSSASSFGLRSGFLYFPLVIAPALTSATAGNSEVDLVWTTATADAGWTISGYDVCTDDGGGFSCEDVGNVLLFTKAGLTNGTAYTFKVQAKDAFGNDIAESGELSATPSAAPAPAGGGGGGSLLSTLRLTGYAYPRATVTILRDGILWGTTIAAATDGTFGFVQSGLGAGTYTIGLSATDTAGRRSVITNIPLSLAAGADHRVANIVVSPTISLTNAVVVSQGQQIGITGSATPNSRVRILLNPGGGQFTVSTPGSGTYIFSMSSSGLIPGAFNFHARTELVPAGAVSLYSSPLGFSVTLPGLPVAGEPTACANKPDISGDGRINLVDFSILAYWWHRPLPIDMPFDLNCDGQVRLDDFSILAYYWSG